MVQDAARNAIYSQGYAPDGSAAGYDGRDFELDFSVIRLNEALGFTYSDSFRYNDYIPVTYVNATERQGQAGNEYVFDHETIESGDRLKQVTRSSILDDSSDYSNTAQAIASNASGDYVVVWTEEVKKENSDGSYSVDKTVYARTYRALYITDSTGTRKQVIEENEGVLIEVYSSTGYFDANGKQIGNSYTDPRQASVAMSDRGEFVVVWDMRTFGAGEDGSRDVYMKKYAFNGARCRSTAIRPTRCAPTSRPMKINNTPQSLWTPTAISSSSGNPTTKTAAGGGSTVGVSLPTACPTATKTRSKRSNSSTRSTSKATCSPFPGPSTGTTKNSSAKSNTTTPSIFRFPSK